MNYQHEFWGISVRTGKPSSTSFLISLLSNQSLKCMVSFQMYMLSPQWPQDLSQEGHCPTPDCSALYAMTTYLWSAVQRPFQIRKQGEPRELLPSIHCASFILRTQPMCLAHPCSCSQHMSTEIVLFVYFASVFSIRHNQLGPTVNRTYNNWSSPPYFW